MVNSQEAIPIKDRIRLHDAPHLLHLQCQSSLFGFQGSRSTAESESLRIVKNVLRVVAKGATVIFSTKSQPPDVTAVFVIRLLSDSLIELLVIPGKRRLVQSLQWESLRKLKRQCNLVSQPVFFTKQRRQVKGSGHQLAGDAGPH